MLSQPNETPEDIELHQAISRDKRWLGLGVIGFGFVLMMVGGVGWGYDRLNHSNIKPLEKSEITIETPIESQKPQEEQRQNYSIEILNGSGVTGAASGAAKKVEERFQEIGDDKLTITTGNGPAQTGTTIQYKSDGLRRSKLAATLSELYPEAKSSVLDSITGEVKIILGK